MAQRTTLSELRSDHRLGTPATSRPPSLEEVERQHIVAVLRETNWRIEGERGAAKLLNLQPSTLRSRMQKLGIVRQPD
jgi:Transcriptional regulator containing GAF, AAA-type ATPase, and DNA binding domains